MSKRVLWVLFLSGALCFSGSLLAQGDAPKRPPAGPSGKDKGKDKTTTTKPADESDKPPMFLQPTAKQAEAMRKKAEKFAIKTREFTPKVHLVETKHFLLFSPWNRSGDRRLAEVCEKMYKVMCKQFDVPAEENVWVGKCPIYIFDRPERFEKFCLEVDKRGHPQAGGYCAYDSGGFVYIVMNECGTRTRFYEVLVHEATHGFLWRYCHHRRIPIWLNEGLAEYMASTLVPKCHAARNYKNATKEAIRDKKDVSYIFKYVGLVSFDYGIAQSLVRFLIAKNRKGFVKLVNLMKEGKTEAEALKEAYNVTQKDLLKAWYRAAGKALR